MSTRSEAPAGNSVRAAAERLLAACQNVSTVRIEAPRRSRSTGGKA
jgi:hypothetical protein